MLEAAPKLFPRFIAVPFILLALLVLGCGKKDGTPPPENPPSGQTPPQTTQTPTPPKGQTPSKPTFLAVTAEQLAQDFIDAPGKAYKHSGAQPVQVTGVISKRTDPGPTTSLPVGYIQVSGKGMDGKPGEWTFVMVLPKTVKADDVAVGKKVTLRGTLAATGGGTTTIDVSEVVRE